MKKTILSQRKSKSLKAKQKLKAQQRVQNYLATKSKLVEERHKLSGVKKPVISNKKDTKLCDINKEVSKIADQKRETSKSVDIKKIMDIKKSSDFKKDAKIIEKDKQGNKTTDIKKEISKLTDVKKINKLIEKKETFSRSVNREITRSTDVKKETKSVEVPLEKPLDVKKDLKVFVEKNKKETIKSSENIKRTKSISDQKESCVLSQGKRTRKDDDENNKSEITIPSEKFQKHKNVSPDNKKSCVNLHSEKIKNNPAEDIKNESIVLEKPKRNLKNSLVENKKSLLESSPEMSNHKSTVEDIKNETNTDLEKNKRNSKNKFGDNKKQTLNSLPDKSIVKKQTNEDVKEVSVVTEKAKRNSRNISLENKKAIFVNSSPDKKIKDDVDITEKEKIANSDRLKKNCKVNDKSTQGNSKKILNTKKDVPETTSKRDVALKKEPLKSNDTTKKDNKTDVRDNNIKTNINKHCTIKGKKDVSKKDEDVKEEDAVKKSNDRLEDTSSVLPKMQRPSRKTKEAAAIYMEILSHKLVNDSRIDDDNISIDSFPELPNVKKTEQRENELKAQAKYTKDDVKIKSKINENEVEIEIKDVSLHVDDNKLLTSKQLTIFSEIKKSSCGKKKNGNEINILVEVNSTDELKKPKFNRNITSKKSADGNSIIFDMDEESTTEKSVFKRQTRNCNQINKKDDTDDSDESFHIDIKIPRVKKLTRSKTTKVFKSEGNSEKTDISFKVTSVTTKTFSKTKKEFSSSDSDQSTTSDINLQTLINKAKNKKFSKTKSMKKTETAFSDSDEEPLSKLTNRSVESSQNSTIDDKVKEKCLHDLKVKESSKPNIRCKSNSKSSQTANIVTEQGNAKPKRECTKRPQNYLPMLSSSDEDDIFHGFDKKIQGKIINPVSSIEPHCSHTPPFLDLLSKDIGRRFGKEKVNMSNEQIEKWLKDSALAGSSIKKENDEMLKFGERIPTETTLDGIDNIDTQKLKTSLLEEHEPKKEIGGKIMEDTLHSPLKSLKVEPTLIIQTKPQIIDRKLIFRKSKKDTIPNVNAFSPENESSVYAFGEENEDVISTPFRRPSRRPSSTATSRSEDESSKHDDSLKIGEFFAFL